MGSNKGKFFQQRQQEWARQNSLELARAKNGRQSARWFVAMARVGGGCPLCPAVQSLMGLLISFFLLGCLNGFAVFFSYSANVSHPFLFGRERQSAISNSCGYNRQRVEVGGDTLVRCWLLNRLLFWKKTKKEEKDALLPTVKLEWFGRKEIENEKTRMALEDDSLANYPVLIS